MTRTSRVVGLLRVLLVLAFGALLAAQVAVLPVLLRQIAEESPELASLRWPVLALAVPALLCVQVVIACTWRLLTLVEDDRIFSAASMGWVNTIVGALAAAWVLLLGGFGWSVLGGGPPGLSAALLLVVVAGAVVGLLMVVMRALLRQATTLRTDMDAVI
ncbi:DUF2975 domain-containing protein [Geodermatophilus sabuli]|uniref:DUF2975 domain-containing protein n=1 Tax=Geodermatophilus sabuli TaxID=1564158 RepID=UPI000BE2DC7C|nr:DUF2975 domain-containing protein [Geodermatophilus sabuli]MBB3083976.1 hypothetical protein [Geodermatophilus sabuli]